VGDVPGAGIGLASAKTIVEQHGGQIRVASALGVGTTVVVVLPPAGHRPAPRRAPDAGTQEQTDRRDNRGQTDRRDSSGRTPVEAVTKPVPGPVTGRTGWLSRRAVQEGRER
jgi:hypothetical protein